VLYYVASKYIVLNMKIKTNRNIAYSCKYHVIWCPKYRRKVLVFEVEKKLKEIILSQSIKLNVDVIEIEIVPDHVHLLVEVDPQYGIHRYVKNIKGFSSRVLRNEFRHLTTKLPTLWTNSYFVSSVGGAPLKVIKQYIENQKRS